MSVSTNRLLRLSDLVVRTGLSASSLYNRMNPRSKYYDPSFPKRVRLSFSSSVRGAVAWESEEVEAWVKMRRDAEEGCSC
ncbi:helix-turn-helix transcriptional regulator [Halopseudomonas aestusnigri]|uniref:helix-turn-helix transcriptional regulator n=1 Tax=Halopseudomonas aestusnigri TaxID=857252 RepID=UPI00357117BA